MKYTICIIDDDPYVRESLTAALKAEYALSAFPAAEPALQAIEKNKPDLVLLDIGLPEMDGIRALSEIKKIDPEILVVMITAFDDIDTVVEAMKSGAHDYVVKPIHMDTLAATIKNVRETIKLRKEVQILQEAHLKETVPFFIAESDAIQDIMDFINKVAKSPDTPILIIGETGTGKELIASAIHFRSPNYKGPLVTVNCAAIPGDLIESELFGYEKGAFTGAKVSGKRGLIEESAEGTLFLDEVGDLGPEAQAKLLRFLEAGEFYRVGGTKIRHVQTRVVSATNKDLDNMIEQNAFRKDLYFRLGVIKVQIPSLNERRTDIIPLAKHFLVEFSRKFGKKFTGISSEAEEILINHKWTGNVRELKNIVERGVLIGAGPELNSKDLGLESSGYSAGPEPAGGGTYVHPLAREGMDLPAELKSVERYYIREALKLAGGNESKAAKYLNMNHHTFRYRRKKLQIE